MALPLKPYLTRRFIQQELHANPTKFSSILNAKPTGPVHLIPKPFLPNPTVCPIRSLTQIDHECSGIFNAKPTGADQPLRFKRYLLPPLHPKEASPKSDTNVRAASMPRSPDQLGHSVSASPPDHIEPLLTEAPSQVLLRTPYLLYLHSRTFTGKIPLSFPSKCLCPHTPSRFSSVLFQAIPLPSSLTLLPFAFRLTSLTPPRVLAFLLRSPFLFPTASVFNNLSIPSPPTLYECGATFPPGHGRPGNRPGNICFRQPCPHALIKSLRP